MMLATLLLAASASALSSTSWQKRLDRAVLDVDLSVEQRVRNLQRVVQATPEVLSDVRSAVDAVRVKGPQARPRDAAERRKLFLHLTACGCLGPIDGVARRHYAATNAAEFFAELSTAYLCRDDEDYNKWEPHNQKQLWQFDPDTCKLLERVWDGGEALDDNCDDEPPLRSLICCRVLRWGKPTPCCRWGRGPLARDA